MKNIKMSKEILSVLTAGVLMATPVVANSENEKSENTNETEFSLVIQESEIKPLELEEYRLGIESALNYLEKHIGYENMQADLQCLYYLINREYMPKEVEDELIADGIVYETNFSEQKYENFMRAYNLINVINDYNQSVIKNLNNVLSLEKINYESYDKALLNKYLQKVIDSKDHCYTIIDAIYDYNEEIKNIDITKVIEMGNICLGYDSRLCDYLKEVINRDDYSLLDAIEDYSVRVIKETYSSMIDVSELCYGEADKALVHNMHDNYFNAYQNGRFDNEYYQLVFKQLTTLNAFERAGNASELSVGARWIAQNSIGGGVMQMLRDDMQEDFTRKELDEYFNKEELNQGQWIVRNDISLDLNCLRNELEVEVFNFGMLWQFVYDDVNNDLMKSFEVNCEKTR